jgi:hypothetical protein
MGSSIAITTSGLRTPQHNSNREKLIPTNNGSECNTRSRQDQVLRMRFRLDRRHTRSIYRSSGANHETTDRPLGCNRKDMLPPTMCLGAEIPNMGLKARLRRSGIAMRLTITSAGSRLRVAQSPTRKGHG